MEKLRATDKVLGLDFILSLNKRELEYLFGNSSINEIASWFTEDYEPELDLWAPIDLSRLMNPDYMGDPDFEDDDLETFNHIPGIQSGHVTCGYITPSNLSSMQMEEERVRLENETRQKLEILQMLGTDIAKLVTDIMKEKPIFKIEISENAKVWIISNAGTQTPVRMGPREKSLYILFLNHPEGLKRTQLSGLIQDELTGYYKQFCTRDTTSEEMESTVERMCDASGNIFHELCSNIKNAFVKAGVSEFMAPEVSIQSDESSTYSIRFERRFVKLSYRR